MRACTDLQDFILCCVLLTGYTAGAIGAGVVAHKWAMKDSAAYDDVFKAMGGTTVSRTLQVTYMLHTFAGHRSCIGHCDLSIHRHSAPFL